MVLYYIISYMYHVSYQSISYSTDAMQYSCASKCSFFTPHIHVEGRMSSGAGSWPSQLGPKSVAGLELQGLGDAQFIREEVPDLTRISTKHLARLLHIWLFLVLFICTYTYSIYVLTYELSPFKTHVGCILCYSLLKLGVKQLLGL